ncbi:MAG: signal transduction histidine kinase [Cyclobacteriaceae bacterium]
MYTLISKYAYNASDSEEIRLAKSLILIISICCSFCSLVWSGLYYSLFGLGLTSIIPLIFVVLVIPAIFISHFVSDYKILVYTQLTCIVCLPTLIQWNLGSIHDSGFVIAWCFLGPLGALLFLKEKHARIWMLIFLLIVGITVIVAPTFSMDRAQVTKNARMAFYLMNIGAPFLVIFIATTYFIKGLRKQKERFISLLQKTNEKNQIIEESLEREKELGLLKTSFVSTASHQFRTPLAAIRSNSELLEMLARSVGKEQEDKHRKVTHRIKEEIAKMIELMDDVLILGKLTDGKVHYSPQEVDLVDFCKKLAKEFDGIQSNGRTINVTSNGKPYNVHLDPKLLTHSLSNLISNAFKYSVGKDNPELAIHYKPKEFVLSIKDYGIGIPKGELKKLFQPFFRAENVIDIKGTGLGLSIAKEYIEMNKGTLTVNSTEGIGSIFEIKIKTHEL